jgi:hypothetical protein
MSIPQKVTIWLSNTQDLKLFGLQDIDTLLFWDAAVVSGTLIDENGNVTMIQNVPLAYVPGTNGNYVGVVTTDDSLVVGGGYRLVLDAVQGAARYHLELPAEVKVRAS